MTFISWPNGVQLCFDFTTAAQMWQFCLALRKSAGAPDATDLANLTGAGETWWASHLRGFLDSTTTLRQVRATNMTVEGGAQDVEAVGTAGTGGTNAPLPIGTASVVSLRTQKRGRSYRGRTYVGGLTRGYQTTPTELTAAGIIALGDHFIALQTALDALGFDMVVASRQHNGVITSPAELNEITAFIVDPLLDSQRRRLAGRGT